MRLRDLDDEIIKKLEDMPITYDIEKDILYKRGFAKGLIIGELKGRAKGRIEGRAEGRAEIIKLAKAKREAEIDLSIIKLYRSQVSLKIIGESLPVSQYRVRKVIKEWKMKQVT